jgi:hypothetical protein
MNDETRQYLDRLLPALLDAPASTAAILAQWEGFDLGLREHYAFEALWLLEEVCACLESVWPAPEVRQQILAALIAIVRMGPRIEQHMCFRAHQVVPTELLDRLREGTVLAWLDKVYQRPCGAAGCWSCPDEALSLIYDTLDDLLLEKRFADVDLALAVVNVDKLDVTLALGFLSITLAARERLPSRPDLVARVETRVRQLAPDRVDALMGGLRG